MSNTKSNRADVLMEATARASAHYGADIYFYSGSIDDEGYGKLASEVAHNDGSANKALLIINTNGGLANSAYQIARLLQNSYPGGFALWCPSRCKSAGTLVALGATKLIMDPIGDLGPLDVQLVKQNEIIARKSGLLAKSSFDALAEASFNLYERLMIGISLKSRGNVSFKLASELSATMASTMMAPIYAQVNPEIVGSENRDLDIAFQYGSRLAEIGGNATAENVYRLVNDYPSHDFIIDANEAETLFSTVESPDESLYQIIAVIGEVAYDESPTTVVVNLSALSAKAQEKDDDEEPSAVQPEAGQGQPEPPLDEGGGSDREGDQQSADGGGEISNNDNGIPENRTKASD